MTLDGPRVTVIVALSTPTDCVEDHLKKVQEHLHRNNAVNTRDTILQELETLVCFLFYPAC